jgi:hypothetical protein
MAALHSLLALYGAFDQSVVEANDPGWTARVAQFLPATTGENQRGWFSEVKRLVDQLAPDVRAAQFPGVEAALDDLTAVANVISAFRDPLTPPSENDPPLLTTTDIAQLLYIFAAGMMLAPDAPRTSVDFTAFLDPPGGSVESIMGLAAEPLTTIYRAAGRFAGSRTEESRGEQAFGLMNLIPTEFTSHRSWPRFMSRALDQNLISVEVATAPIALAGINAGASHPEKGSHAAAAVAKLDGTYCAVLTTDCWQEAKGLTVDAVKKIVDPCNWARLSPFFCQMDRLGPDARGASQVLEHVSTDKKIYQLKTALKNWREDFDGGAVLNYELADTRVGTGDSGLVLVDSGYIRILDNKLPNGTVKGVRIKTSKMVAIQGTSVTATAMLMLSLGWAAASNAMLLDNAVNPPQGGDPLVPWSTNPEKPGGSTVVGAGGTPGQQPGSPPPQVPVGATGALVKEAARMWADCVQATTTDATKIMNKWYQRELTIQDIVEYTTALGGRLASEPWRYLDEMSKRLPATPSPPKTPQDKAEGGSP